MADPALMEVEIAYARPERQRLLTCEVTAGSTVREVIEASGILEEFPEIDLARNRVGIFSHLANLDTVVHGGDRVEIYRPLTADPKEVRRKMAAESKRRARKKRS